MSVHHYGPAAEQSGELWLPSDAPGPFPVVVLIHGGFWRARYDASLMHPLAGDITRRGWAAWNIEYRRMGSHGGDPLVTLADVAAALDLLVDLAPDTSVDPQRSAIVGHSAGGHLALWAGGLRRRLRPRLVIGQAAVSDLYRAAAERLGDGATQDFLGGEPAERPASYAAAQPRLDADLAHLVHGRLDDTVPVEHSIDAVDVHGRVVPRTVIDDVDHMDVIDPASPAWAVQVELLAVAFAGR